MMPSELLKINLYTDGACSGNPGPGGWCCILVFQGVEKELSGSYNYTTNNKMELKAAIEGLKHIKTADIDKSKISINLYSDYWQRKYLENRRSVRKFPKK